MLNFIETARRSLNLTDRDAKVSTKNRFTNHLHFFCRNFKQLFFCIVVKRDQLLKTTTALLLLLLFYLLLVTSSLISMFVYDRAQNSMSQHHKTATIKSSIYNLKYVPFTHALRAFIFCTSTLFIMNSIVFSNLLWNMILKWKVDDGNNKKISSNENNCNDFVCSFQTSDRHTDERVKKKQQTNNVDPAAKSRHSRQSWK